ncbi:MAG: protein arginine kinase [Planctomycetes bacterium]|nr:protein arginine kinase [Planctomycetota bacterium]
MKMIDDIAKRTGTWLSGTGPMNDIVISSRIRLARNLAGFPFLTKSDTGQRNEIYRLLYDRVMHTDLGCRILFVDIEEAPELDRQVLVERHLISRQHAEGEGSRGVAVSDKETLALMVNEEDHLRIQVLGSGFRLEQLWERIDKLDDILQQQLDFAFHEQYGFLTACPTNVGTGIRVSVMLHLPALKLAGELEKVSRAAKNMRLAVRGLHGEGTEATGDFYQISNQTTLGKSEKDIIAEFCSIVIPKIVDYERMARQALLKERPTALDDKIWRAYGTLENARTLSTEETLYLLSHLRMGIHLGRLETIPLQTINDLFIKAQPAHLQKIRGMRLDGEERSVFRADYIRQRLAESN